MNALYHIGIIEGFLAQPHSELPKNIQAALDFLKTAKAPRQERPAQSPRKGGKRRLSKESRDKMLAGLAKARKVRLQKIKAAKANG